MEIEWRVSKTLSEDSRDHTLPLAEPVAALGASIRRRISERGEAADGGRFNPLAPRRKRDRGKLRLKKFKRSGSLWKSLVANTTQPGKVTLQFWGARKATPTEFFNRTTGKNETITVAPTENGRPLRQPALAAILQYGRPSRPNPFTGKKRAAIPPEPKSILQPSRREMQTLIDHILGVIPYSWLKRQAEVVGTHKAERKAAAAARTERKKAKQLADALKSIGVDFQGAS